jgi:nitroreductase
MIRYMMSGNLGYVIKEKKFMESTAKDLKERRSIRSYKPDQIKDEELDRILEAGTYAPSCQGKQAAVIVAIQNKSIISTLYRLNAEVLKDPSLDPFYGAPTVLAVLADKTKGTPVEDGSLVLGNLMNAAFALGVGSCWVHRAKEVFEREEGRAFLKTWGLDNGDYVGIGFCLLGYAAREAKPAARKEGYIIRAK